MPQRDLYLLFGWQATAAQFSKLMVDMDPDAAKAGVTLVFTLDGKGAYIGKVLETVDLAVGQAPGGVPSPADNVVRRQASAGAAIPSTANVGELKGWMKSLGLQEIAATEPKIWIIVG